MITRQQIVEAYECCVDLITPRLKAAGIQHRKRLSLEEFRQYIKKHGWPFNKKYQDMAELAMKIPSVANTSNTSTCIKVAFMGVQDRWQSTG